MKRLVMLTVFGLSLTFASNGFAAGYGAAGCGFGGKVIDQNNILAQLGAGTLNSAYYNQTFAMSSGTSGCGKNGLVLAEREQNIFVENNYQSLTKEMAQGKGENLTVLASLLGCQATQSEGLGVFTQQNYDSIFKTDAANPSDMLVALKERLSADPVFSSSCQKI